MLRNGITETKVRNKVCYPASPPQALHNVRMISRSIFTFPISNMTYCVCIQSCRSSMKVFWNESLCNIASTFAKFLKTVKGHYLLKAIVVIFIIIIIIIIIVIIIIIIIITIIIIVVSFIIKLTGDFFYFCLLFLVISVSLCLKV